MTLLNIEQTNAPRCAVLGLVSPRAMCGAVIVGGDCGSDKPCQHKVQPQSLPTSTVLNAFQSVRPRGVDMPSAVPMRKGAGKPLTLGKPLVRVLDSNGNPRAPLSPRVNCGIAIEGRAQAQASQDKRSALVKGGL
jgi:hypothetical protein